MKSLYHYHKHFFIIELLLGIAIAGLFLLTWFPVVIYLFLYNEPHTPAIKAAILLTSTSILVILLLLLIRREIRTSHIILSEEGIVQKNPYKVTTIGYSAIKLVSFVKVPLLTGYIHIRADKGTLRIPLYINNCLRMVTEITSTLDNSGSRACNADTVSVLKREASISDNAYTRSRRAVVPLGCAMAINVFVNLYVAIFYWDLSLSSTVAWGAIGLLFPLFTYTFAEHRHSFGVRTAQAQVIESALSKKPDYALYGFVMFMMYCISGIVFRIVST